MRAGSVHSQKDDIMKSKTMCVAAAALSGLMIGTAAHAATPAPQGSGIARTQGIRRADPGQKATTLDDSGKSDKHDCKGKNDCKGKGGCNSSDNGCKGKNDCKGKGGCKSNAQKLFLVQR